jgi:hypothetical protein
MQLAILNGFTFHYEMFGYILYFCKKHDFPLTIYTTDDEYDWKLFYENIFSKIIWKHYSLFEEEHEQYDFIFLTTDDDNAFMNIINKQTNVLCIDHCFINRRPEIDYTKHIAIRPFADNYRKWALPCYPIVETVCEKENVLSQINDGIHIVIFSGSYGDYIISQINRLSCSSKITLHLITRYECVKNVDNFDKKFTIVQYYNISTIQMMDVVKMAHYIACDMTNNGDHIFGKSMSGSLPLSFSNLNRLILSKQNNAYYGFTSAITFEFGSFEPIELGDDICINDIYQERQKLMDSFSSIVMPLLNH